MSCACVMNDAACAALTFLPVCALTSLLNAPSSPHAALVSFASTVASDRSHLGGEAAAGADARDCRTEVGELVGSVLDQRRTARRGDGDHEQRIRDRDLARELMAGVRRRRRVR